MRRKILIALGCIALVGIAVAVALIAYPFNRGGPIGSTGLKVILQARQSSFPRGEPMRFRVMIQNMTLGKVGGDFDRYVWDIFVITDPDGDPVPYRSCVGSSMMGDPVILPPFNILIVQDDHDILENYLIVKEGEYTIQVRKQGEDMLESNTVRFMVEGGEAPLADKLTMALAQISPDGWTAARFNYRFETTNFGEWGYVEIIALQLHGRGGKGENRIDVILTKEKIPGAPTSPWEDFPFEYLGENENGFFYIHVFDNTEESWPTHVKDLARVLDTK
jgi:hypothetical protein